MKLRNKKTGLIGEMVIMSNGEIGVSCVEATYGYESLSEFLSGGWEDYEEKDPFIKHDEIRKNCKIIEDRDANVVSIGSPHRMQVKYNRQEKDSIEKIRPRHRVRVYKANFK